MISNFNLEPQWSENLVSSILCLSLTRKAIKLQSYTLEGYFKLSAVSYDDFRNHILITQKQIPPFSISVLLVLSPISSFETTACVLSGPVTTADANHGPHFHNHSDVEHEVGQARGGKVTTGEWVSVC